MQFRRRQFLQTTAALGASFSMPALLRAAERKERRLELIPAEFKVALDATSPTKTSVWSFNEQFPGPLLRFRRGEHAHIAVSNQLPQETTVHWHGLRVPNAMDGVPSVTQAPDPRQLATSTTALNCAIPEPTGITPTSPASNRCRAGCMAP